jgi:hypothetical protein
VVTVHPHEDKYVFIHGPKTRMRTGITIFTIVAAWLRTANAQPGRDGYHRPYTPGALRGGSHVHVFSPNGSLSALPITTMCCTSAIRRWICATSAWRRPMAR